MRTIPELVAAINAHPNRATILAKPVTKWTYKAKGQYERVLETLDDTASDDDAGDALTPRRYALDRGLDPKRVRAALRRLFPDRERGQRWALSAADAQRLDAALGGDK